MPVDLREALHGAAAAPAGPLDLDRLLARGHRRRRTQRLAVLAGVFGLAGAVAAAGALVVPDRTPVNPIQLADLPPGWTELPPPPEAREQAAAVWTGEELLVWGGDGHLDDGAAYDPAAGTWREMAPSPLAARELPAAAWTGEELLVWGGDGHLDDGAAYDPATDTWRPLPPAPIDGRAPLSVWTGRELIVWGTVQRSGVPRDGAAYDPATDTWRAIADGPIGLTDATAAWTGDEMIVFGAELDGNNVPSTPTAIGAAYDPVTDTWRRLPDSPLSPQASTAVWTGQELIAWDYLLGAAAYDPAADSWRALPDVPLDTMECYPRSVVVGEIVFGDYCGQLAVYDTADGRWYEVARPGERWFQLVPAGPVVLVLGSIDDEPAMLAYRYRPCCTGA
jgi:hypothetical protein